MLKVQGLQLNKESMKKMGYQDSLKFQDIVDREDNYVYNITIKVNLRLVKKVGLGEATYLSNLIRRNRIFFEQRLLDEAGYFPCKESDIENEIIILKSLQRDYKKDLIDRGLILVKESRLSEENSKIDYFKINFEEYLKLIN